MERMKNGNLKEARDVANEMVFGNDKFIDTDQKVFKSFHSVMEKNCLFLTKNVLGEQSCGGMD